MGWLRSLFTRTPPQPRVYAVQLGYNTTNAELGCGWIRITHCAWTKAVMHERPQGQYMHVVGPFRSEVDCDEFIEAANMQLQSIAESQMDS